MSSGECERPDDRPVYYGEVRHLYDVTKGLLSWRILGHTVHEEKTDRRNSTNEENNLRECLRMKNKQTISWKRNYKLNHWEHLDWKHKGTNR